MQSERIDGDGGEEEGGKVMRCLAARVFSLLPWREFSQGTPRDFRNGDDLLPLRFKPWAPRLICPLQCLDWPE